MHLDDGQLRAFLDGELDPDQAQHLDVCQDCQNKLAAYRLKAQGTARRLAFLTPNSTGLLERSVSVGASLVRFKRQYIPKKELNMFNKLFSPRFRLLWFGLVVLALLAIVFSIPTVQAWAGQFLGLFRVQQVTIIPVDTTNLSNLGTNSSLGQQIGQLLSSSATVTKKPGQPQSVSGAGQASQLAGFQVRLPESQAAAPQLTVQDGAAFQFVVDRAKAQAILDEAGHSDLQLPASLDGANIKVNIPASVQAGYGNCPKLSGQTEGSIGRRYADCVFLVEMPSPTVETPPDVNMQQLAEMALEFTGMPANEARAFSQSVDWTTSLVIPIPRNAATYQQVQVDGVSGWLIQRPIDDAPEYALIWVKDGIIYTIGALGSDSASAVQMANSLK